MLLINETTAYRVGASFNLNGCNAIKYEKSSHEVVFYFGGNIVGKIQSVNANEWNDFQKQVQSKFSATFIHSTPWTVFAASAITGIVGSSSSPGMKDVNVNFDSGVYTVRA